MLIRSRLLLLHVTVQLLYHAVNGRSCQGGADIFSAIKENSPKGQFIANFSITAELGSNGIRLCLGGPDAYWMFLDGRTIRLNTSHSRVLDREVKGSLLVAQLICSQDNVVQSHYRILVQILNENDNKPVFLQKSTQDININELAALNTVVFSVKAVDADGDLIKYIIDPASPDSAYFRIDLPDSGNVVLDKPLDYETKTRLQLLIWATDYLLWKPNLSEIINLMKHCNTTEANTEEMFNTSTRLIINVQDGDDQYPHFVPCVLLSPTVPVCTNPSYSANITEKQQNLVLEFSPGPIQAEDGDRGLNTVLMYSIVSGDDYSRFVINNSTGHITLTRAVDDRQQTPFFRLSIMASQLDDPLKYKIASVLIKVLVENMFPPIFNKTIYKGFVFQSSSPAAIVSTYGNQVLLIQVSDQDFPDGLNPNVQYSLYSPSVTDGLYHITRGGVLIAQTDRLHVFDRHIIQVIARDEESGEEVSTSVDIEVLQRGQAVPHGKFTDEQFFRDVVETHLTGVILVAILVVLLIAALFLLLRLIKRKRSRQGLEEEEATNPERHPKDVTSRPALNTELSRSESLHGQQGLYTRKQSILPLLTLSLPKVMNKGRSPTIPFSAIERSEGPIDPATLSLRVEDMCSETEAANHSSVRHSSTQAGDMVSQSTTRLTDDPYHTMVTVICAEPSSGDRQ